MPYNLSAIEKFNSYVALHPAECSGKSAYEICTSIMNMSPEELQEIEKNKYLLPFQYAMTSSSPLKFDNFGINQKNTHKPSLPKSAKTPKGKIYHHQAAFAEVDDNGNIKTEQFTFEELKKKYNSKDYIITQNKKNGTIIVKHKADGSTLLRFTSKINGQRMTVSYYKDSKTRDTVSYDKVGQVRSFRHCVTDTNGNTTVVLYENGSKKPKSITKTNKAKTQETIYNSEGNLEQVKYYNKDDKDNPYAEKFYSNNKLYKFRNKGKTKYTIVDELSPLLHGKGFFSPEEVKELSDNILKRLNSKNGNDIATAYSDSTGRDLLDDIKKLHISKPIKDKLIAHVESVAGSCLAYEIYDDISGLGSGKLEKHIQNINVNNIKDVMQSYRIRSYLKNRGGRVFMGKVSSHLDKIGLGPDENNQNGIVNSLRPYEGLLTAISKEVGLKDKRYELINHIVNTALKNCAPATRKRAWAAINSHPNDYQKIEIDLYRAMNLEGGKISNKNFDLPEIKTTNNTFDGPITQGKTGDCWLIAGINSALSKEKSRQKLEQLVQYNEQKDMYYVTFKGLNKVYMVKGNLLNGKSYISSGSKKFQAIEIALDSYKRDHAYNSEKIYPFLDGETFSDVDIVGGKTINFWKDLFGNTKDKELSDVDCMSEDFNHPNKLYSMWLKSDKTKPGRKVSGLAVTNKGNKYTFRSNHELSIVGSDKDNIYLIDPNDSSETIIISRENYKKLNSGISCYNMR